MAKPFRGVVNIDIKDSLLLHRSRGRGPRGVHAAVKEVV